MIELQLRDIKQRGFARRPRMGGRSRSGIRGCLRHRLRRRLGRRGKRLLPVQAALPRSRYRHMQAFALHARQLIHRIQRAHIGQIDLQAFNAGQRRATALLQLRVA